MGIDVANEAGTTVALAPLSDLAAFLLEAMRIHPNAELSVVLVDEGTMAELHVRWMDLPGPTDVMSFPMDELRPGTEDGPPPEGLLGDIVMCPVVAERQAAERGHTVDEELAVLLTHGLLHLLGYDHADDGEAREMFALQNRLLAAWEGYRQERGGS
jgi:probable rRNA maturation factor